MILLVETFSATLIALGLAYGGMTSLCLAIDRHYGQVWGRALTTKPRRCFHVLGWLLLALALWPCIEAWSPTVGVVVWIGCLSAAALLLALLLPYAPRLAVRLAVVAVSVAGSCLLFFSYMP
ncbi:DUF3325 domain-containing protein [Glaciimonas sp. PCH181]|nr:DUF3325 domain-containing protein [Glaciimonas sp. PCH181]